MPLEALGDDEVTIRVDWSSVNYKDALAASPKGRVARISPLIPGIDLAGEVTESTSAEVSVGQQVLAHGYDLGVSHHGGFSELARVPGGLGGAAADGLTAREAMAIGTAGYTAAMCIVALEERGLAPGDGEVLVLGASGGVGSVAVSILAGRGYTVAAVTGKPEQGDFLRELGAARDPCPRRGHGRGEAARARALGRLRRRGRRRAARVRVADAPLRRVGSLLRERGAAATSRRRSSRSSCAASRCSGSTRARRRSRGGEMSGTGSAATSSPARSATRSSTRPRSTASGRFSPRD